MINSSCIIPVRYLLFLCFSDGDSPVPLGNFCLSLKRFLITSLSSFSCRCLVPLLLLFIRVDMVIACFTAVASKMFGCYCPLSGYCLSLGLTVSVRSVFPHNLCLSDLRLFWLPFSGFFPSRICLISFAVFEVHHPNLDSTPGRALPVLGGGKS